MRHLLTTSLITLLLACAPTFGEYEGNAFEALTKGTWDWVGADNFCNGTPHSILISNDKKALQVIFHEGKSDSIAGVTNYNIRSVSGAILSTNMEGETRTDEQGNIVSWELIVNSPSEYCWRRSDWSQERCSAPRVRCDS